MPGRKGVERERKGKTGVQSQGKRRKSEGADRGGIKDSRE